MTLGSWPQAVPFDPEGGAVTRIWEEILAAEGGRPRAVLLVSGEAARYSGWSSRAALALADALAASRRVLLVDLHLEQPELDGLVSAGDVEGVADLILYGASLDRVALASTDHAFELVPVGGPIPDPEALLLDRSWGRLLENAERLDLTLLLYVPWRARGLDALVRRVGAAVFLGGHADARVAAGYLPPQAAIRAVFSPASPRTSAAPTAAGDGTAGPTPAAVSAGPVPRQTGGPRGWLWAVVLLVIAGAIALYMLMRPGADREAGPASASAPPAAVPPVGQPTGQPLPYAVAVEAHQDLAVARERVGELGEQVLGMTFFIAPVLVDSVISYRVMAGPLADSSEAAARRDELVAAGHKTSSSDWDIRMAPLAFELGTFDEPGGADARAAELAAHDVPAYVLPVPYSNGRTRYHVYCGAYAGPAEADIMRQLLAEAGIDATLVQRIGRPTS